MSSPLIGVTTTRVLNPHGHPIFYAAEAYIQALVQAGGCPVLIPLGLPEDVIQALYPRLDAVLFTGGGDVHPDFYQGEPHPLINTIDEDRDRIEIHLIRSILAEEKPWMGICRGFQVVNVALGGDLFADIHEQYSAAVKHDCFPKNRDYLAHPVEISENSRLHSILQSRSLDVNSLHHQGVKRLAPILQASAYAPDGLVEAFELPNYRFGLGVQWHPEWLSSQKPTRELFKAFVEAAQG